MSKSVHAALIAALLVMVTMIAGLSMGLASTGDTATAALSAGCCCCPSDCPLCDCTSCADCVCCAEHGCVDGKCDASASCTKACCAKQ